MPTTVLGDFYDLIFPPKKFKKGVALFPFGGKLKVFLRASKYSLEEMERGF